MSTVKQDIEALIQRLPEDCTIEDVQYTSTSSKKFGPAPKAQTLAELRRKRKSKSASHNGSPSNLV